MLKSISFANCPSLLYFTDNGKAIDDVSAPNYTTPFWNGADDNDKLTTITLNEGTLDFGIALAHLKALTTQNIKNTRIIFLHFLCLKFVENVMADPLCRPPIFPNL